MIRRAAVGAAMLLIALLTFYVFPGHTWLQQDTQIYAPILENQMDPSVLSQDLLVQFPHVSFTLYDEIATSLRRATGWSFESILGGEQILFRALGAFGIYLIAVSAGLDTWAALFVSAVFSLGALIVGPSVLTLEYEPTPRAFALPLTLCAIGCIAVSRYRLAGVAIALAVVFHAPTTAPFWLAMLFLSIRQGREALPVWTGLLVSTVALAIAVHFQPGPREAQAFLARLTPAQESVQRMRAAYNWISVWGASLIPQYLALYAIGWVAYIRMRGFLPPALRAFAIGLPALGMLSIPASYLLLERLKWALIPQLQPMRALLFVTAFAVVLAALAGLRAARLWESAIWFALVFYIPIHSQLLEPPALSVILVACALAIVATLALRLPRPALVAAAAVAFIAIAWSGCVQNYPQLHTHATAELSRWARENTPRDAVFLFPDAGHKVTCGIFRAEAQRSLYVDWKSGGQVNYLKDFASEWTIRWNQVNRIGYGAGSVDRYRQLGIQYLVLYREHSLPGLNPIYQDSEYAVYRISG